jgi:hypothetical protein
MGPSMADSPRPEPTDSSQRRGRWVAIVTGTISVLVAVLYLILIAVLDSRGPLLPPPPEALGEFSLPGGVVGVEAGAPGSAAAPPPG